MNNENNPRHQSNTFYVEHTRILSIMKADHYHNFYEIYYYLGDEMSYFIENKTYDVRKFDMVLIDKYTYHRTRYKSGNLKERIIIKLDDNTLDMITDVSVRDKIAGLFKFKKISFPDEFNRYLVNTFVNSLLPVYYKSESAVSHVKAKLILLELLLSILEMMDKGMIFEDNTPADLQESRVGEIINYINANYYEDITLDMLASHFFINKFYLCHIFKKITGISIIDYVNKKRLIEAEILLKRSGSSITNISTAVGFNSTNHFTYLFKKRYGCTPKSFKGKL